MEHFRLFPTLPQDSPGMRNLACGLWIALLGFGTGLFVYATAILSELWIGYDSFATYQPSLFNLASFCFGGICVVAWVSKAVDKRISRLAWGIIIAVASAR